MINFNEGVQAVPIKAVIYGAEGIGKSTLASKMPGAVFFDIEGGTARLPVKRVSPKAVRFESLDEIMGLIDEVIKEKDALKVQTIVFDTVDALELIIIENVCKKNGKNGIEAFGYGKGYTYVGEEMKKFLDKCDAAIFAGINVTLLAHAKLSKFEQPDEMGAYDRWSMKLTKISAPLVKEWADMLLFCNYKTHVVTVGDGMNRSKKVQGGKRVVYTSHHPCWDAKNRFDLPDEFDLDFSNISKLYEGERASIDFGVPPEKVFDDTPPADDLPFEIGDTPQEEDPHDTLAVLMVADSITDEQIIGAFKGKYATVAEIPADVVKNKLIDKWDKFKFFLNNQGGN